MFNINDFERIESRYAFQIERITAEGKDTSSIENTVNKCIENIKSNNRSFVIYGEPQSGKTEMMICLTAKLLDEHHKIIIVLLNDNLELLDQNIKRFTISNINPSPKKYSEVLDPEVTIGDNNWIIFSKKNSRDLEKLIDKVGYKKEKVIIDDEADYASPNAKINKGEKTAINRLIDNLLTNNGIYIGVTATPVRLDLNNTFNNISQNWVDFKPHEKYHGQEDFFQLDQSKPRPYTLIPLPDKEDKPQFLREALFSFIINVSYLNTKLSEKNYSMLIHTSGIKDEHMKDLREITKVFDALYTKNNKDYEKYWEKLFNQAKEKYPGDERNIIQYAVNNITRHKVVLMNSETDRKNVDFKDATIPICPYTIAIGGNIISRGVTFENLLSMFFTRAVKHKMQQDTYIQRARMFGSRNEYLKYFELHIPQELFSQWHQCFVWHRLNMESIRSGNGAPAWIGDDKTRPVAPSSIDKANFNFESGEMSFARFSRINDVEEIVNTKNLGVIEKLKKLKLLLGEESIPQHIINFVEHGSSNFGNKSCIFHESSTIMNYNTGGINHANVSRDKGVLKPAINKINFPDYVFHHFKIFFNSDNMARIFYTYEGKVKFYRNTKNIQNND
jgi:hypothetical protein